MSGFDAQYELTKPSSLGHMPGAAWKFDEDVTRVFSDMLSRSIPQYDVMRKAVFDVGSAFVKPDTYVVDVGCSRGDALEPFVLRFGSQNKCLGLEISEPMLAASRQRFKEQIENGLVEIRKADLRTGFPDVPASLILSVLTVQFVPIEHRQQLLFQMARQLRSGGGLVFVEKVLGGSASINKLLVDLYHRMKKENGYSEEEIERKRLALEGVLVPVTSAWNEELLKMAGFRQVDCFWRWMNFGAWVAVKD
jgi:tRNA (cmo5U34)-methyltransferase